MIYSTNKLAELYKCSKRTIRNYLEFGLPSEVKVINNRAMHTFDEKETAKWILEHTGEKRYHRTIREIAASILDVN